MISLQYKDAACCLQVIYWNVYKNFDKLFFVPTSIPLWYHRAINITIDLIVNTVWIVINVFLLLKR